VRRCTECNIRIVLLITDQTYLVGESLQFGTWGKWFNCHCNGLIVIACAAYSTCALVRPSCQSFAATTLDRILGLPEDRQCGPKKSEGNIQYCEKKAEHDSHIQFPGFEAGHPHVNVENCIA
jgi:hypothetical protein